MTLTNPKTLVGRQKFSMSVVPANVLSEVSVAIMEGALKYGRHNYREGEVEASIYYDAAWRHLSDWWEGVDIDPDSGIHHVTKAIASLIILADAIKRGSVIDDRPPTSPENWQADLNAMVHELRAKYHDPKPPIVNKRRP